MKKSSPLWKGFLAQLGRHSPSNLNPSESSSSNLNQESIASTSSESVQNNGHRVFLSFRGVDTRKNFVDHLYGHLTRKGISVFKDDISLRKGDSISPQLMQAIGDSHVSVVVFSKDYAASSWCLEEMAFIAHCKQEANQTVFPVFYDVDPSHVRHQSGPYKKPFVKHKWKKPHKVRRWKRAMKVLASSAGWDVRNKPEFQMIENLVEAIVKVLDRNFSGIPDDLIGMQPRVQELESILNDDDVRVLGIWGMNGIGKTTQVTVLYDKISHKFNGCCFIRDVSEIYKKHIDGASVIQKQILLQTFKEENLETCDSVELSRRIKQRLHNIRVLIVLDNVDQIQQLKALAIDPKMLMKGSRMIITTTDKKILRWYSANVIHEVSLLNDNDARELFYKKAFENKDQISDYVELMIPDILKYAQRLPLAIEVMGSCLRDCNLEQWIDLLHRLENDPDDGIKNALQKCIDGLHFYDEIKNALQKCVDGLHFYEKEIFLHIACFFNGERKDYVDRILECCELYPWNGISRMVEKSLITLRDEEIYMHEMLKELGKEMVCDQHLYEPERWSRLWLYKDFSRVLTSELGADNVQAIVLNKREDITECNIEGMSRMKNLRLLILYHSTFSGSLDYLSSKLRYFSWNNYPFDSLPSNFVAIDLVELNMPNSKIKRVWEGCKNFPNMKRIELSNSKYLTESPDFSKIPKLERLDLSGCTSLSEVHPTIGLLEKLAFLSLRNCNNLVSINFDKKSNLSSLRVLHLSGCTKLKNTPDFTSATNLEYLDIDGCTSLTLIDESIGSLANLTYLSLRDCKNVVSIPHTINTMSSLQTLDLRGCLKLVNLSLGITVNASYLMPLIFLDISFCNLLELPDAILMLECLERMNLQGNNFVSIPNLFRLRRLAYLNLSHCNASNVVEPLISVNALTGVTGFRTMKVTGLFKKKPLHILIDSGSTHNFLDVHLAKKLGCEISSMDPLSVTVADGARVQINSMVKGFSWLLHNAFFKSDMLLLPLGCCDMVLGIEWLITLGDITWNFEKLTMEFMVNGRRLVLRGTTVLALPNFSKEFVLEVDASGQGVGAVLMQDRHPIAYISRCFNQQQQALSTYEKELLGVVFAVQKWRHYLLPKKFTIRTDHQSLKYILDQRLSTEFQQKWLIKLMEFDFNIEYKQGRENVAADALSMMESSPYEIVYGQTPPTYLPYLPGESKVELVDRSLQKREEMLKLAKFHMKRAQERMKQLADKHRSEREFQVGDLVFVKLHPYRQIFVAFRSNAKLAPKYYGPYPVLEKIGAVAYKVQLPANSLIHNVFHVSQLKKLVGEAHTSTDCPISEEEAVTKEPEAIIDRTTVKRGNKDVTKVLVKWKYQLYEDAT
uniref:TMV resistance protein N n=1 Tax=Cajanus cajan TaxID=3821 RepID=A0A151RR90_CAJCA|nr:TMV resistance protein N [Cajanus cajan]